MFLTCVLAAVLLHLVYATDLHDTETNENKRKIEHWRVAPVFKRILRMGIPALIGRGGSPYIRTRSSLHPKSRFGPDISSTEASHQTPFRKLTTLISRCFPAHMEIIYER